MRGIIVFIIALASVDLALVTGSSLSLASPVPEWGLPLLDQYCDGRMFCTREAPEHRTCIVFDGILDLSKFPPVATGLERARPASFDHGAFMMRCDSDSTTLPPRPVLSNAFGAVEGLSFGDVEVSVTDQSEQCWYRKDDKPRYSESCLDCMCARLFACARQALRTLIFRAYAVPANDTADPLRALLACVLDEVPTVTVVLNRDMDGNIFHALFNTAFALFKASVSLGVNMSAPSTAAFMFDVNPLSRGENELLLTLFAAQGHRTRFQHWARRPIPGTLV